MEYLIFSLSETFHALIGILSQRNPIKHKVSSLIYALLIFGLYHLTAIYGYPTYIANLLIFVLLITGYMVEPGNQSDDKMQGATVFATLPFINIKVDSFIQPFIFSFINLDSLETEFYLSHLSSLIIIFLLTRAELAVLKRWRLHFHRFTFLIIPITLSLYFYLFIDELTFSFTELNEVSSTAASVLITPFLALPILCIMSVLFLNNALNKSQEVAREKEQFKVSQAFSSMMADQYQEMRKFRHDYKNILLTLEGYIRDQEWQGLADYFHQHIQPTQVTTDQLGLELSRLSKIQSPDVRNLLFTKLAFAGTNGIDLSIEVPDDIHLNVVRNPIYLVRIIGILLDNAIEALSNQEGGKLTLAVFEDLGDVHLIIENDCQEDPGDLNKLLEAGYSTKGSGRGLGLSNALELARESQFQLTTQFANERFTQHLLIRKELLVP